MRMLSSRQSTAAAAGIVLLLSCGAPKKEHAKRALYRMDTIVNVTVVVPKGTDMTATWSRLDELLKASQEFWPR